MKRLKFCFFGEIAGALNGKTTGGAQVQIALLAKALAMKGHEVVVIDPFSNQGSFVTPEGVRLLDVPGWNKGLPVLRMFTHRLPALYKMFLAQKADFYYVRTRAYVHLASYLAAKKIGGKFIQAIASDIDVFSYKNQYRYEYKGSFNLAKYLLVNLPNDVVLKYLLRKADYVLLQHAGQNINLGKAEGKVVLFPNIIDSANVPKAVRPAKNYVIYVGSLSMLKGADILDQLTDITSSANPVMIVGQPNDAKSTTIYAKLTQKKNVVATGRLSHTEALQLIAESKAVINTSNFEGFPNIFLEAWASGVPVISLNVNPGDVFNHYKLGICCHGDIRKMKAAIEGSEIDQVRQEELLSYIAQNHDFETAADRFLEALDVKTTKRQVVDLQSQ